MHRIKWKVCGLRDNIDEVVALQPDFIGFIFYKKSPRFVSENFKMPVIESPNIDKVGVFVNESMDFVNNTKIKYRLEYVQLHGKESPEFCEKLMKKGVKIIKAFQVDESFDFDLLKAYESVTDFFLFDTKTKQYGGSGVSFDWRVLDNYCMEKKFLLSGGLALENLCNLIKVDLSKIYAIDVNSKFEISPGLKNIDMLKELKIRITEINNEKII